VFPTCDAAVSKLPLLLGDIQDVLLDGVGSQHAQHQHIARLADAVRASLRLRTKNRQEIQASRQHKPTSATKRSHSRTYGFLK
jgi:hypothetical protein